MEVMCCNLPDKLMSLERDEAPELGLTLSLSSTNSFPSSFLCVTLYLSPTFSFSPVSLSFPPTQYLSFALNLNSQPTFAYLMGQVKF